MAIGTQQLRKGDALIIRALCFPNPNAPRDPCPTLAFFAKQAKSNQKEFKELCALLDYTAAYGPPQNEQKFKHLSGTDGIYEFKTWSLRLFCFMEDGSLIICMDGTTKKSNRTPPADIKRAKQMKSNYEEAKKRNAIHHANPPT